MSYRSALADRFSQVQMGLSMRVMQQLLQRISAAENLQVNVVSELPPERVAAGDEHAHTTETIGLKLEYDCLHPYSIRPMHREVSCWQ